MEGRNLFGKPPTVADNPFIKTSSENVVGNLPTSTSNPFFLSKPAPINTPGKGFNIFGKPQDNSAVMGTIIHSEPVQVAIQPDLTTKLTAVSENPFLKVTSATPLISGGDKVESKIEGIPNPFLDSIGGTKINIKKDTETFTLPKQTLPNPFFESNVKSLSSIPNYAYIETEPQSDEKIDKADGNMNSGQLFTSMNTVGNIKTDALLFSSGNSVVNPFLTTVTQQVPPMLSSIATLPVTLSKSNLSMGSRSATLPKNNFNIISHSRSAPLPGRVDNKRPRSSLDDLKPSLASLADNLKNVICTDSESKYDILEKIDKAIRKGVKSNFHVQDGKRYRALKGTCMDMCPEKERFFRDDKHLISPFELTTVQDIVSTLDGEYPQLNHYKAVKEYSRSSADQEEPLPHQIRPAPVLSYTMNYLIANIMDVKYANRTDWFDFLWNRTRAIRKDITQQNHPSCIETISVIEKCARFHIFCYHYLCEHELHVFDSKLNLENLTKCLQTLKHLYEDQRKENKEVIGNESEFRGYQILLNLNDGDILREVMTFRKEVRESAHVKFALKIFNAVQDNNYVRFFKLVKSTSYLNACLIQPYFTQIRDLALTAMVRTFSQPNKDVPYPLENLKHILAFDDAEDTSSFCELYGITSQELNLYFNRSSFTKPEEPIPLKMSAIVTNKLISPMSEIVNNGPLVFNLEMRETIDSFSTDGKYVGSYHLLDDDTFNESIIEEVKSQKREVIEILDDSPVDTSAPELIILTEMEVHDNGNFQTEDTVQDDIETQEDDVEDEVEDEVLSHAEDADPDYIAEDELNDIDAEESQNSEYSDDEDVIMFLREDFVDYVDELLHEEISEYVDRLSVNIMEEAKEEVTQSQVMTDQELAIMCIEQTRMAVAEVIDEEQLRYEKERHEMIENESIESTNSIIDEYLDSVLHSMCADVCENETDKLEAEVLEKELVKEVNTIVEISLNIQIKQIASDTISEISLKRKNLLESNKQTVFKKKLSVMFKRWIKAYKQQQFIKSSLIDFPPLPPMITTRDAVLKLHPDGDISYSLPDFSETVKKIIERKVVEDTNTLFDETNTGTDAIISKSLSSIIEDVLSTLFFKAFHEHCLFCERKGLPPAAANDMIKFYNNTLFEIGEFLKSHVDKTVVEDLCNLVRSLKLPQIKEIDPCNWDLCCLECQEFVSIIFTQKSSILSSHINNILEQYKSRCLENEEIFPWSEILEACIFHILDRMYLGSTEDGSINFDTMVSCEPGYISSISIDNPLKEHIKLKRFEYFELKNSLIYQDEMRRQSYTREYSLRKSLDSVDSELSQLEASLLNRSNSLSRGRSSSSIINHRRSSSLHELLNQSTSLLDEVEFVKQRHFSPRVKSLSPVSLDSDLLLKESEETTLSPLDKHTGSKRTFEYSMVECLAGIDDYRMKLKTKEEYWRSIINQ